MKVILKMSLFLRSLMKDIQRMSLFLKSLMKDIQRMSLFLKSLMKVIQRMSLFLRNLMINRKRMISLRMQLLPPLPKIRLRRRKERKPRRSTEGNGKIERSPSRESMERKESMIKRIGKIKIKKKKSMVKLRKSLMKYWIFSLQKN